MSETTDPIARIAKHLDEASAPADQAAACATIAIICSQATPPENLDGVCEKLLKLLDVAEEGVKPNAIAALSAGIEVSEQFFNVAVQGGAASKLVALLTAATANPTAASSETKADPSGQIILNSISALGALAEASEAGLQSVVDSGGIPAVTAFCTTQFEPPIQEAAADSICKILASGAAGKEAAEKAGVVPALAQLLSTDAKAAEVTVRALMGLSMVVAGSEAAQIQLASTPGVVKALLALMRQGDDGDCQHIAAGLFSGLASSPASKDAMATAMREAQQQAAENAQYIG